MPTALRSFAAWKVAHLHTYVLSFKPFILCFPAMIFFTWIQNERVCIQIHCSAWLQEDQLAPSLLLLWHLLAEVFSVPCARRSLLDGDEKKTTSKRLCQWRVCLCCTMARSSKRSHQAGTSLCVTAAPQDVTSLDLPRRAPESQLAVLRGFQQRC